MGQVLIRNLDDETIAAYKEAASRHSRSLEAELRAVLTARVPMTEARRQDGIARLAAIRAMTPDVPQTPSEMLVRQDRDGFRDV